MEKVITKEQAIKLYESKFWLDMDYRERAGFQLYNKLLCMPFDIFHEAMEKSLKRPVFTHEFGLNYEGLCLEFSGKAPKPTFEDVVNLIPEDKRVIIVNV